MLLSLFYFGSDVFAEPSERYRLLIEGAKFADDNGLLSVWTPERHFERFGGLYPNPCITTAALATITRKIRLRAGSSIQPFHNPVCMAENWALVDNISNGRIDVAFGSGWHVNDFVLAPDNYEDRREIMFRDIETIQQLWKGEFVELKNGAGKPSRIRVYPPPIQGELPVWVTAQSDETFAKAGNLGFNVLTNLNYKNNAVLENKIRIYRAAIAGKRKCGYVTLMVHTFVSTDRVTARRLASQALIQYLTTNLVLQDSMFLGDRAADGSARKMNKEDALFLAERGAARIIDDVGLIGTPMDCLDRIAAWEAIGVDEIACLIDFGISNSEVLAQLPNLLRLIRR